MSKTMTRRAVLARTPAAITGATAAAALPAAALAPTDASPLADLYHRYRTMVSDYLEMQRQWGEAFDALPEWAKGGWPLIDKTFPDVPSPPLYYGCRVDLKTLRVPYRRSEETVAVWRNDPDREPMRREWLRRRDDTHRVTRWWIGRHRQGIALRVEAGVEDIEDRTLPLLNEI